MKTKMTLPECINQHEKIELNAHVTAGTILLVLGFISLSGFLLQVFLYRTYGFSILLLFNSGLLLCLIATLFYVIGKRTASAYIKGDALIVRYLLGTAKVTDLRCLRSVKTHTFLGIYYTTLKFKFDGVKYTAFLLGKPEVEANVETIIHTLRKVA